MLDFNESNMVRDVVLLYIPATSYTWVAVYIQPLTVITPPLSDAYTFGSSFSDLLAKAQARFVKEKWTLGKLILKPGGLGILEYPDFYQPSRTLYPDMTLASGFDDEETFAIFRLSI